MIRSFHNSIKYSIWCRQEYEEVLNENIKSNDIVIVGLSWCPWTRRAKSLIKENYNIEPKIIASDIVDENYKISLLQCLSKKTSTVNVPQIFVGGEHIGDFEKLYKMHHRNQINSKLFV